MAVWLQVKVSGRRLSLVTSQRPSVNASASSEYMALYKSFITIMFLTRGKPLASQKLQNWFRSEPYSGRSSSIKPSRSKTELKHCTTTKIRWNKNEDVQTSLVVATNRLPNSLKNWSFNLMSLLFFRPLAQSRRLNIVLSKVWLQRRLLGVKSVNWISPLEGYWQLRKQIDGYSGFTRD